MKNFNHSIHDRGFKIGLELNDVVNLRTPSFNVKQGLRNGVFELMRGGF